MLLSAVIIVRDEAEALARCLSSVEGVVDQVVVVDTGSTDDSLEVARSHGCVVAERAWDDDFATPRNLTLDLADGEWVLYIDADETLAPVTRGAVEQALLADPRQLAQRLWLRARPGYTPYREYRVWRNRPDIRFRGIVHETVVPDINALVADGHGTVGTMELLLEHDGYEGDQQAKHRRNLPLLLDEVERRPHRPYLWQHIGLIHAETGDRPRALEAWRRGASEAAGLEDRRPADCLCHYHLVRDRVAHGEDATAVMAEADRLFAANAVIDWAGVLAAEQAGATDDVISRTSRLLSVDRDQLGDDTLTVDERVLGEWSLAARGRARLSSGDPEGAVEDFRRAERLAPDDVEYRTLRRLAEARCQIPR